MTFARAIAPCTPAQQARQDTARARGCICCVMEMCDQPFHTEINHQTIRGMQISQDATEALCAWHHRGICLPGMSVNAMRAKYGPSLLHHKREFVRVYGDHLERLEFQNAYIGHKPTEPEVVALPKILPRRYA